MYVAVPLEEILCARNSVSQLVQYCSISDAGYHPMGVGRMLNMMPNHAGMTWSPLGETYHGVPVKSPASTVSVPFADAADVDMINLWMR
jgi:hypothetical protein